MSVDICGAYRTLLDLEFDDWLDPSLPVLYTFPLALSPFVFFDEFTSHNEEFCDTGTLPAFFPVMKGDCVQFVYTHESM